MANSTPTSKSDQALAGATANAVPAATAAGAMAYDANHSWDSTTKSLAVKALSLLTPALAAYSVTSNVVTVTTATPHGFTGVNVNYVTILVSDGNTWLNGTYLIGGIGSPTTFVVSVAHANSAGGLTGTATFNPQEDDVFAIKEGEGDNLFEVGPLGSVEINGSVRNDTSLLDVRGNSTHAQKLVRFFPFGVTDNHTYISGNGGIYSHAEFVCSGTSSGTGDDFTVTPPTSKAFMVGVWLDVGAGVVVRGTGIVGCQALQVLDSNGIYKMAVRADDGRIEWMSTATSDGDGLVAGDANLYRSSAGHLATDSVFIHNVATGANTNAVEVRDLTAGTLFWFVDSAGNMTINNVNARVTYGNNNQAQMSHDNTNGTFTCNVGNFSIAVPTAGKNYSINTQGVNRVIVDATGATFSGPVAIGGGTSILKVLSATAALDFGSTSAQTSSDLTISVTGAVVGNSVTLGLPAAPAANTCFAAWVSAADTVTVRFHNYSSGAVDPASGTYRATVHSF